MKLKEKILTILFLGIILFSCQKSEKKDDLIVYLKENGKSPTDYVIDKFNAHDYVFIGEYHRIKHDVDLINELIPKLYEHGIYNLAIEFGDYRDQNLVDSLLSLPHFDRDLARKIIYNCDLAWEYKEYIDIYKTAWQVNHDHEKTNKFRIINISAHYDPCKQGGAWKDIDPDVFMANVVFDELVSKNKKALIYSGNHHAFTRYHQPIYNFEKDTLLGFSTTRMGNIICDSLKNKTFNIYLHAGWISNKGWDAPCVLPVNGVIDSIMNIIGNKPIGFDVIDSPFGKLTSNDSYYSIGHPDFRLDQYCDGYIFQHQFRDYLPITLEDSFYTSENIDHVKEWLLCLNPNDEEWGNKIDTLTVDGTKTLLFEDIRTHFEHLMK